MRLTKLSTLKFLSGTQKDTEAEVLTREGIEEVERVGAAIRVFKAHDIGGIFKIVHNLGLAAQYIGLILDKNIEYFRDELKRTQLSLNRVFYYRIPDIVAQQATFSKEGTLALYAADEAIRTLQEILDNLKKERANLENIRKEFNKLYKGEKDLSSLFEEFFKYIDGAIEILQSRIEIATGAKASYSPQSIVNIIKDICSNYPNVKLENHLPQDMKVNGNRLTLTNALVNLISNAVWFAEEAQKDKAEIRVVLTEKKGRIKIDIIDNGKGISKDMLGIDPITERPRLFSLNVSKRKGGSGLGTTDAWYAIKDHEGTINVQSELGKGTTFTITLPVSQESSTDILKTFAEEIDNFTKNERKVFEAALKIKDLKIGFDLERTLTCNYPDELGNPGFYFGDKDSLYQFEDLKDLILRPGAKALILGLLVNNEISILTAASKNFATAIIDNSGILKNLIDYGKIKIFYDEDIKRISMQKAYRETEIALKKEGVSQEGIEWFKMSRRDADSREWNPIFKIPSFFGLDVLIDDNSDLTALYEEKFRKPPDWYIYINGYSMFYKKENGFYTYLHTRKGVPINENRHITKDTLDKDTLDLTSVIKSLEEKMFQKLTLIGTILQQHTSERLKAIKSNQISL
jgi:signal transduction histidine kinase